MTPHAGQFKSGTSGNPAGRPPKHKTLADCIRPHQARLVSKAIIMAEAGNPDMVALLLNIVNTDVSSPSGKADRSGEVRYVYIVADSNHVKIGHAKDVRQRMKDLLVGNPMLEKEPLHVCGPMPTADAVALEGSVHAALQEYHVAGEWFDCTRDTAIETLDRLAGLLA